MAGSLSSSESDVMSMRDSKSGMVISSVSVDVVSAVIVK